MIDKVGAYRLAASGRDRYGRSREQIARELELAERVTALLDEAASIIEAGELTAGREAGPARVGDKAGARLRRIQSGPERLAERDRELLERPRESVEGPEADRHERGGAEVPRLTNVGTGEARRLPMLVPEPPPPPRTNRRRLELIAALIDKVGAGAPILAPDAIRRAAAQLSIETLDDVVERDGPWVTNAAGWAPLPPSTRADWLLGWLAQLAAQNSASAEGSR